MIRLDQQDRSHQFVQLRPILLLLLAQHQPVQLHLWRRQNRSQPELQPSTTSNSRVPELNSAPQLPLPAALVLR